MTDADWIRHYVDLYDEAVKNGKNGRRWLIKIAEKVAQVAKKEQQLKIKLPNTKQ